MKIVVIYASTKGKNTEKIAEIIKESTGASIFPYYKIRVQEIMDSDVVVFCSDIYSGMFHKGIFRIVKNVSYGNNKKVFIFSTTSMPISFFANRANKNFKKILIKKGFNFIDSFNSYTFSYKTFLNFFKKNKEITLSNKDIDKIKIFSTNILESNITNSKPIL